MQEVIAYWQVTAGVSPGLTNESHTRVFEVTEEEWEAATKGGRVLLWRSKQKQATDYAESLAVPGKATWVALTWVWVNRPSG